METGAPMLGEPLPVELMNTIWADRDGVHDALSETTGAMAWLQAVAPRLGVVTGPEPGARDDRDAVRIAQQLVTLRDAVMLDKILIQVREPPIGFRRGQGFAISADGGREVG